MLTLADGRHGLSRRGFLSAGALGLGGLSLSSLMAAEAERPGFVTGKSVIFLFQQGGPSQFETFDPKPDAPEGIRTVTGTCRTSVPGVHFGDTMTQLSRLAHKLVVVRSFQTNNAGHNIVPIVGPDTQNTSIGALYARAAGTVQPRTGMPTSTVLFPQSACTDVSKGAARGNLAATGTLGQVYAPFIPGGGGQLQKNMQLGLPRERLEDRRQLLAAIGKLQRAVEQEEEGVTLDRYQDQAYQLLLGRKVADALDLSKEDAKVVARYDTSRYAASDGWKKANRGKRGYYTGHAKSLGKLLLLGRRLCEAGCGFVNICAGYEGVWDMHADGNNLNMIDGMQAVGRSFDHAVAAFIEDLESRGLSDKILLVCCGEMGRTPKINKRGGRDHWARLAPLMMYGGGLSGQVIGRSNKDGGEPASDRLNPKHLISSLFHTVFDPGLLRLQSGLGVVSRMAEHATLPVHG